MDLTMYSEKAALDKFYTKSSVAEKCINQLNLKQYDFIIEPSAGNGAFSKLIPSCLAFDLAPEHCSIKKQDWFEYKNTLKGKILVVGNPPFGIRNNLSKKFIKHAIPFAQTIAMVLPNVYQKHTTQSIFPKGWRLVEIFDIGKEAFEIEGVSYHVPCSFFIFDKSEGKNLMFDTTAYNTCSDFEYSNIGDIFVMGAGLKVKLPNEVEPNNRGYWLKTKIPLNQLIKNIESITFKGHSSANGGVSWLTKQEFIKAYTERNY